MIKDLISGFGYTFKYSDIGNKLVIYDDVSKERLAMHVHKAEQFKRTFDAALAILRKEMKNENDN